MTIKTESTTRFSRREWVGISKSAWEKVGERWHEKILPRHFEKSAPSVYGYAPRSSRYMKAKATAKGHQRPLVYKGDLERAVERQRDVSSVRARGDDVGAVNVKLSGPRYLHQRPQARQPNLAAELSAVSERDADELAEVLGDFVTDELGKDGPVREVSA